MPQHTRTLLITVGALQFLHLSGIIQTLLHFPPSVKILTLIMALPGVMSETVAQVQMAKQVTPMSTAGRTVRILEPLSLDQFLLFLLHLLQSFQLHLKLHLMFQLLQKKHLNSLMLVRQMLLNLLNNQSLKHLSLLQLQFWPELSRK